MKKYYICTIIGDGSSIANAYRPAIADVLDPATGFQAFVTNSVIKSNEDGSPALPWCLTIAEGPNHKLVEGNSDIDPLPLTADLATIKVSAIDTPSKLDMAAKLQARGIDTSFVNNADGLSSVIDTIGQLHDSAFSYKNFDVQG